MKNLFVIWIITIVAIITSLCANATTLGNGANLANETASIATSKIDKSWGLKQLKVKGNGKIVKKEVTVKGNYTQIDASRAVNVIVENRQDDNVVITADENVMEYAVFKVENGKMVATISDEVNTITNINVKVHVPQSSKIDKIRAASGAEVMLYPTIKTTSISVESSSGSSVEIVTAEVEKLKLDASSAARIKGSFKTTTCDIDASSAAKIDVTVLGKEIYCDASSAANIILNGQSETLNADASSASDIDAHTLVAAIVKASASSGGDVDVFAQKQLNASASSGGGIRYKGPVSSAGVSASTSSGGSVKQM